MKVLVLNCGSSSLKFQLIDMTDEHVIAKGIVEEIGHVSKTIYKPCGRDKVISNEEIKNHEEALEKVLGVLLDPSVGVLEDKAEIVGVGHRVVHGGADFDSSTLVNDEVLKGIEKHIPLSPLHNPANLQGIQVCQKLLPDVPQVAVFDTAHGANLPSEAYTYAIPKEWRDKHSIRRYGFHGTSHAYVARQAAKYLEKPLEDLRIITCHLGSGASISAVKGGKCVETSMGFTPLEGLIMSTRCGDVDPAILPFISRNEGLSVKDIDSALNKQSGMEALIGETDYRVIEDRAIEGSKDDIWALDVYMHRIKKYIGAYMFIMGGVDVIVFTAGVGEHSPYVRERVCKDMDDLGIVLDEEKNNKDDYDIGTGKVKVLVIPTNEELAIARDTKEILESLQ